MRLLGRIFSIVLVLIIPLLLTAASCNLAVYNTMSNERTYRDAFADRSLLSDITPYAVPALMNVAGGKLKDYPGSISPQKIVGSIGFESLSGILASVVSKTWMQDRFDQILRLFTGILSNDYTALDEMIDVESVRMNLEGDSGQAIALKIVNAAPRCTADQETQIQAFQDTSSGDFPICNPASDNLKTFSTTHIAGWLADLGNQLQVVTAAQFYSLTSSEARGLHVLIKLEEQTSYVLYLCPGALLALIVFFTVRSFRSFGRWIGGSLLFSGVAVLIALVVIQIVFVNVFGAANNANNDANRLLLQIFVSLLRAGLGGMSQSMLLQAGLMILAGFGLIGLTVLVRRSELVSTGTTVLVTDDGQVISSTSLPNIPVETGTGSSRTPVK